MIYHKNSLTCLLMNYRLLFQKAIPELSFKYVDKKLVYQIEYIEVNENNEVLNFDISLKRVEDDIRVTVVRRILLQLLFDEIRYVVSKYMGIKKFVNITVDGELEVGI